MSVRRRLRNALIGLGALAGATYPIFHFSRQREYDYLEQNGTIAQTACGSVQYAVTDSDVNPVMVLHGVFGSYEHTIHASSLLHRHARYRVIAPSRPGYVGTPLSVGRTAEEQAHAMVALMDALNIERLSVAGISGGTPTALAMARLYPDRIWRLVLVNGVGKPLDPLREAVARAGAAAVRYLPADYLTWIGVHTINALLPLYGLFDSYYRENILKDPEAYLIFRKVVESFYPIKAMLDGYEADLENFRQLDGETMGEIRVKTMIVHSTDSFSVPLAHGQYMADHIPGAKLLTYSEGAGHAVHLTENGVWNDIIEFLHETRMGDDVNEGQRYPNTQD